MRILLDIDGVMIPARPWQSYQLSADGFGMFSKFAVEGLNRIIQSASDPEIILTTSHKHNFTLMQWEAILFARGIVKTQISRLETNSLETSRTDEINNWYLKNPNVPFIILDDDKGLNNLDSGFKDHHLVLTESSIGLNSRTTEQAIGKVKALLEANRS